MVKRKGISVKVLIERKEVLKEGEYEKDGK